MSIRERWIALLHRAATSTRRTRNLLTPIGVAIFGGFVPLFVGFNVWELKRVEEPELARRLGDDYIDYRRRTPMFLPRLRRVRS